MKFSNRVTIFWIKNVTSQEKSCEGLLNFPKGVAIHLAPQTRNPEVIFDSFLSFVSYM